MLSTPAASPARSAGTASVVAAVSGGRARPASSPIGTSSTEHLQRSARADERQGQQPRDRGALADGHRTARSVLDPQALPDLAVEAGPDAGEARAARPMAARTPTRCAATSARTAEPGANGVPFFVFDRRYGSSGGQPAEVFTQALEQAWASRLADSGSHA